ncbi:M48 family metallopeptidase [Shewanella nanhaiensis]|uniref:M48 family metallopeptidase n=1 Tax=Shewanella nanhaiensis TaxID=2864872 RepID=UPI003F697DB8
MNETIKGHLMAPQNSTKHAAELILGSNGYLILKSEAHQHQCQLEEVALSDAIGSMPRSITFSTGWVFISSDGNKLNSWLNSHCKTPLLVKLERNLLLIFLASIITLLTAYGLYVYGVPKAAKLIANQLPVELSTELGEQGLTMLNKMGFEESKLEQQERQKLRQRFDALIEKLNNQGVKFKHSPKIEFRYADGGANAFTLADGTIILTDAMVKLANEKMELEGVILHELGHVHHDHVMTNMVQTAILSITAAMVVGDSSGISDTLASIAVLGGGLTYSRIHESEADDFAAHQLYSWLHSTAPLADLFEKLRGQKAVDMPSWSSTHPALSERVDTLRSYKPSL